MLQEQDRQKLDSIVQQMVTNKESESNIKFVVNDFKSRYDKQPEVIQQPKQTGLIEGIGQDIQNRGEKLGQQIERISGQDKNLGIQNISEVTLNVAGQGIGAMGDIGGRILKKVVPGFIKKPIKQGIKAVVQLPLVQSTIQGYKKWKEANPRAAQDLESATNIASLIPIGKGAKVAGEEALSVAGEVAGEAANVIESGLKKQSLNETLDIIKPILTKKEKEAALNAGRGVVTNKILPRKYETISLNATKKELEMANVVQGVIKKGDNPIDNMMNLSNTSYQIGQKIRTGLEQSDAIWNKNELKGQLNKVEKPITVKSDVTINNQAKNFTKAVITLAENTDKKPVGILDVRQEFDNLVNKEFPNLYDKEMTPMRQYISNMRQTLNKFAESKLPEGQLPDGTTMSAELRRQHLMLDAKENIAEKTATMVDSSVIKRVMGALRQNPLVAGVTGGILTYGALVGMFSNPLVIGSLVVGGTYKLGKTIITSKILRESLVHVLRGLENAGKAVDASTIKTMINQLPKE